MRILLADDTIDMVQMYCLAFMKAGHTVHTAYNGQEALSAARSMSFDVILLDAMMPVVSGWEATATMRQWPHCQRIPIVVFTAYSSLDYERQALEAGADRVVIKPVMPDDLLEIMAGLVKERDQREAPAVLSESAYPILAQPSQQSRQPDAEPSTQGARQPRRFGWWK